MVLVGILYHLAAYYCCCYGVWMKEIERKLEQEEKKEKTEEDEEDDG